MDTTTLNEVRRKFVRLYRVDPPPAIVPAPREPLAPVLDRWVAQRFSLEEVRALLDLELERGPEAVSDWFSSVVREAGLHS